MPIRKRSLAQPVSARFRLLPKPEQGSTSRYADSVEEYVFSIPTTPIKYTDLVINWVLPYQESAFQMFGIPLRLTPQYKHTIDGSNNVVITGLLCETRGKISNRLLVRGPRGTWHGRIKFFAKAHVQE